MSATGTSGYATTRDGRRLHLVEHGVGASRGRHVAAPRSGHNVMLSEPDVVADEVERIVRHLRTP